MSAVGAVATGVLIAAAAVMAGGLVWLRVRRPKQPRHRATGPSWDRPTHLHTVVWEDQR